MVELRAIYVLWLREIKKLLRAKERIIGSVAMPLMFLTFIGFGFQGMTIPGLDSTIGYIRFLVPGMIGMNMLFSSMFSGISVLWDREFGFLKEIMVAPVSRISIALGRIAGGASTGLLQGAIFFGLSFLLGFSLYPGFGLGRLILGIILMIVFMILIALTFNALGLAFAANMRDAQGFELIINFVMFPLFFLSGAIAPIGNLPGVLQFLAYANPLTYGVDGMRGALIGASMFSIGVDLIVCLLFAGALLLIASFFFERSESV